MYRPQLVTTFHYSKVQSILPISDVFTVIDMIVYSSDILKEYRRLDDTIVMRLNRANAAMRDEDRIHGLTGNKSLQDQACEKIWRELVGKFCPLGKTL